MTKNTGDIGVLVQPAARSAQGRASNDGGDEHFQFEAIEPFLRGVARGRRAAPAIVAREPEPQLLRRMIELGTGPLQRILNVLPQGAALLDINGAVLHANAALARLCGVSPKAWGEMPLEWHLSDESRRGFRRLLAQMRRDGHPASMDVHLRSRGLMKQLTACWLARMPEMGLFVVLGDPEVEFEELPPTLEGPAETELEDIPEEATERVAQVPELLGATVLLLEEERGARERLCRTLEELGCQVYPVQDSDALIGLLQEGAESFDAMLLDPWRSRDGADPCLEMVTAVRPQMPVVAYTDRDAGSAEPLWAPGVEAVLSSPVDAQELGEALRCVFEARRDRGGHAEPLEVPGAP